MYQQVLPIHLIIFVEGEIHDLGHRQAMLCYGEFDDGLHRGIAMLPSLQHRELNYPCKFHV